MRRDGAAQDGTKAATRRCWQPGQQTLLAHERVAAYGFGLLGWFILGVGRHPASRGRHFSYFCSTRGPPIAVALVLLCFSLVWGLSFPNLVLSIARPPPAFPCLPSILTRGPSCRPLPRHPAPQLLSSSPQLEHSCMHAAAASAHVAMPAASLLQGPALYGSLGRLPHWCSSHAQRHC
jgi:hypothetical protein